MNSKFKKVAKIFAALAALIILIFLVPHFIFSAPSHKTSENIKIHDLLMTSTPHK